MTPCELLGANWEMWHGKLFTAATAPTDGITLVALYSAWAANGGYIRNFPLLPFGVPNAPTVLGVGGTRPLQLWYDGRSVIGP